jgi:hypothetical protein
MTFIASVSLALLLCFQAHASQSSCTLQLFRTPFTLKALAQTHSLKAPTKLEVENEVNLKVNSSHLKPYEVLELIADGFSNQHSRDHSYRIDQPIYRQDFPRSHMPSGRLVTAVVDTTYHLDFHSSGTWATTALRAIKREVHPQHQPLSGQRPIQNMVVFKIYTSFEQPFETRWKAVYPVSAQGLQDLNLEPILTHIRETFGVGLEAAGQFAAVTRTERFGLDIFGEPKEWACCLSTFLN